MKIYKIITIIAAFAVVTACGDRLADLNNDPNVSLSAGTGEETLTSGQGFYGLALEAYFNEYDALMAQYWAGGPGVALIDAERYFVESADFNVEWSHSYLQALSDLKYTIDNGNEALAAVADIYSVMIYQNLVDHFGDVPYSQALSGDPSDGGIVQPVYDDSKTIYDDLVVRLDAAIATLGTTTQTVGAEDLVYGGNLTNWIAFANSLKLRLLMTQSITDASVGTQVIDLINTGTFINSSAQMAQLPFAGLASQNPNPQFARRSGGVGQFYIASNATVNFMNGLNDPRLAAIYDAPVNFPGSILGVDQGNIQDIGTVSADDFSFPSAVAYGETNSVILMSHWEVMFLRAEADMRFGTADDETAMFNAAVTAHFAHVGAPLGTYLGGDIVYDATASVDVKSNLIGTQMWISMNGLQEAQGWITSRRFDTPSGGNVFTNTTSGIFQTPTRSVFPAGTYPSIRLYPQSEIDFNAANVPAGRVLTDRVFWDN